MRRVISSTSDVPAARELAAALVPRLGFAFVLIWFGVGELVAPGPWTGYIPGFLHAIPAVPLIIVHGYILFVLGCLVAIGLYTRPAAGLGTLMVLSIALTLILSPGGTALAIRDIGLTTLGVGVTLARAEGWTLDWFLSRIPHLETPKLIRRPAARRG